MGNLSPVHFCLWFCYIQITKAQMCICVSDVFPPIGKLRVSLWQWNPRLRHVETVFTVNVFLPFTVSPLDKGPDRHPPSRADCCNMNGYFTWELIRAPRRDSCMTMRSVAAQNPTVPDFQCFHCVTASQRCPSAAANQSHQRLFVVLGDVLAP